MLIYELNCKAGHAFEGWFNSLEDLQKQLLAGKISCPICGSQQVHQVPSAFAISKKNASHPADTPVADEQQAALAMEQAIQHFFINNFEDVGTNFFSEALKIHYGASPARNIRGISTGQEEDVLRQEGVDFFKFSEESEQSDCKTNKPIKSGH